VKYNHVKDKDCARTKMYPYSCTTSSFTGFRNMTLEATCSTFPLVLGERLSVRNCIPSINCFSYRFFDSFENNMALNRKLSQLMIKFATRVNNGLDSKKKKKKNSEMLEIFCPAADQRFNEPPPQLAREKPVVLQLSALPPRS